MNYKDYHNYFDYNPGDIVMFLSEHLFDKSNIIVEGMIGEVVPDFYGVCWNTDCVMIQPLGSESPFGYPQHLFRNVSYELNDGIIQNALALYQCRFEVFEARMGWTGYVKIKNHIFDEARIKRELGKTITLVLDELSQHKEAKSSKGHLKRIRNILKGFHKHPSGEFLSKLADDMLATQHETPKISQILQAAFEWSQQPTAVSQCEPVCEYQT